MTYLAQVSWLLAIFALEDRHLKLNGWSILQLYKIAIHCFSPQTYFDYNLMLSAAILKLVGCCALDQVFHGCNIKGTALAYGSGSKVSEASKAADFCAWTGILQYLGVYMWFQLERKKDKNVWIIGKSEFNEHKQIHKLLFP